MFSNVALARRIDAAEAELTLQAGRTVAKRAGEVLICEFAGAVAVSTGEGSPFDKVIGLGFEPFEGEARSAFSDFEDSVLGRGRVVQVELASLADASFTNALAGRGYALVGFENVLGLRLNHYRVAADNALEGASGVVITRAEPRELEAWVNVVAGGAAHPDLEDGPASHESFQRAAVEQAMRDLLEVEGFASFLARRNGVPVGGASMRLDAARRLVQLTGASTLPTERRRGVQSALLRARLVRAVAAGAEMAVVTTRPGSKSQENAMKSGFALLYTRAVLTKPGR